jgi:hypothetical protein
LTALLQRAELAKFARLPASAQAAQEDLGWLRQFVTESHRAATKTPTSETAGGEK